MSEVMVMMPPLVVLMRASSTVLVKASSLVNLDFGGMIAMQGTSSQLLNQTNKEGRKPVEAGSKKVEESRGVGCDAHTRAVYVGEKENWGDQEIKGTTKDRLEFKKGVGGRFGSHHETRMSSFSRWRS